MAWRELCEADIMAKKRTYDDDDGRTIVDMSEVDPMPMLLPRFRRKEQPSENEMSKEDRRAVLLGSIGAVLLIGAIFIAAAALVIFVMTQIWK